MRYAWLVILAVGCYEAPDYSGTRFKCDAEHPCPPGQDCVNGTCNGGGGSNTPDAAAPAMTIACGASTCGAGEKCCSNLLGAPSCIAIGAPCAGIAATCDGVEDCAGGACCEGIAGVQIGCAATCAGGTICRDNEDCANSSATTCCLGLGGANEPWGRCLTVCP